MNSAIENVWERVKATAHEFADDGVHPSFLQAQAQVARYFREAGVHPWPPDDIIEMYARELLRLIDGP